MQVIQLSTTTNKRIPVEAEIFGLLALHRSLIQVDSPVTWSETHWTVTHVPTGYAVETRIHTRDRAVGFLKEIQDLDWNFKKPEQCERVADAVLIAKQRLIQASKVQ